MLLKSKEYCLHDTALNDITVEKFCIELIFEKGIYSLSEEGKEARLTDKCVLKVNIDNFQTEHIWQHLQILSQYKRKIKEISILELKKMLLVGSLIVDDSFWSDFSNGLIIKGNVNKYFIELKITEINAIEYSFK